jgi:hypothetical protein
MKSRWMVVAACLVMTGCGPVTYWNATSWWLRSLAFIVAAIYMAIFVSGLSKENECWYPSGSKVRDTARMAWFHIKDIFSLVFAPLSAIVLVAFVFSVISASWSAAVTFFTSDMAAGGWTLLLHASGLSVAGTAVIAWLLNAFAKRLNRKYSRLGLEVALCDAVRTPWGGAGPCDSPGTSRSRSPVMEVGTGQLRLEKSSAAFCLWLLHS